MTDTTSTDVRALVRTHATGRASLDVHAKRALDIVVAVAALVVLGPAMIVIAILVWRHDGGPWIFAHERIGAHGKRFLCLKFRSMCVDAEERLQSHLANDEAARIEWERVHKLRRDPRVTPIGRFLRKTSLDELPQLLNVLRGDMSIVGPRPIYEKELECYGPPFRNYVLAKPGITGLWQISGRNDLSFQQRVSLDTEYLRTWSLVGDVMIIVKTVPCVLLRRGSY